MTDSAIFCDTMDVYLDRVIALNKSLNKDQQKPDPKSDDPRVLRRPDRHARVLGPGPVRARRSPPATRASTSPARSSWRPAS